MKNNFYYALFVALFAMIAVYSCSRHIENAEPPQIVAISLSDDCNLETGSLNNIAFEELNSRLVELNDRYPSQIMSRGRFWNWFKRIVFGDFLGACLGAGVTWSPVGAVFFGIMGSINGALYESHLSGGLAYVPENVNIPESWNPMIIRPIDVGFVHNRVIYEVYQDLGNRILTSSDEIIRSKVIEKMKKYVPAIQFNTSILNNTVIPNLLDNAIKSYENTPSEDIFGMVAVQYPSRNNEVETLTLFCTKYSSISDFTTRTRYVEDFTATVTSSGIGEDSKNYILSSISVASYSDMLWKEVVVER